MAVVPGDRRPALVAAEPVAHAIVVNGRLRLALLVLNPSSMPVALPSWLEMSGTKRDHLLAVVGWAN